MGISQTERDRSALSKRTAGEVREARWRAREGTVGTRLAACWRWTEGRGLGFCLVSEGQLEDFRTGKEREDGSDLGFRKKTKGSDENKLEMRNLCLEPSLEEGWGSTHVITQAPHAGRGHSLPRGGRLHPHTAICRFVELPNNPER